MPSMLGRTAMTMKRFAVLAAMLSVVNAAALATQARAPALEWYDADGEPLGGMGSVSRTKLAETDLTPRARSGRTPAKTSDGRIATGVGYNAWFDGARVHITTVLVIPKDPNITLPRGVAPPPGWFTYVLLARFSLAVDEARTLHEMKKFGWDPVTIRVHPPGFRH
jgi:hypothetical protein